MLTLCIELIIKTLKKSSLRGVNKNRRCAAMSLLASLASEYEYQPLRGSFGICGICIPHVGVEVIARVARPAGGGDNVAMIHAARCAGLPDLVFSATGGGWPTPRGGRSNAAHGWWGLCSPSIPLLSAVCATRAISSSLFPGVKSSPYFRRGGARGRVCVR